MKKGVGFDAEFGGDLPKGLAGRIAEDGDAEFLEDGRVENDVMASAGVGDGGATGVETGVGDADGDAPGARRVLEESGLPAGEPAFELFGIVLERRTYTLPDDTECLLDVVHDGDNKVYVRHVKRGSEGFS